MTGTDQAKQLEDLVDEGTIAMFMTMIGDEHTSRPLSIAEVRADRLAFLIDATTDWAHAVREGTAVVHVAISDVRKNTYVSLQGAASVALDHEEIDRLWNPGAAAYFDGKDDPGVGVLRFDASSGEYWDAPGGRIGSLIALVKAAVAGDDAAGEQGQVATQA